MKYKIINKVLFKIDSYDKKTVTAELPIFLREHFNGMYRTDVYFLAKSVADVPLFVLLPFLFVVIDYWAIGLNSDADRFFICSGIVVLVALVAGSFGIF